MNSKDIYSSDGRVQWQPYVYKLTLSKGEEEYYYIGCRYANNKYDVAHLDDGYMGSSKVVAEMINEGWSCNKEILETFEGSREGAEACVQKEIELLKGVDALHHDGYLNMNIAGAVVYTEEVRKKMSEAKKGKPSPNKGKPRSEEIKRRLSEANKGKRLSEETRKKMSEARQNISDETRRKLSEANKGKRLSEETRKKMSEAQRGKRLSEETKRKMSEAKKGRVSPKKGVPWSPERRAAFEAKKAQKSEK